METEIKEEKVIEPKKNKVYIIVIILLLLIVFGLCGYIVYDNMIEKEKVDKSTSVGEKEVTNNSTNKNDKTDAEEVITEDEALTFLNTLVSDSLEEDLLIAENDEQVFINSIKYLTFIKDYTKDGNQYVFNKSDIQDLAYKYYMKDNYNYLSNDNNFTYDDSSKTYRSELNFGLFSPGPSFEKTRTISNFTYADNVATLTYNVKVIYDSAYLADPTDNEKNSNYNIELVKENGSLRINKIY